jgi:hypothetical protein
LAKNYYLRDHRFDGFVYRVGDNSFDAASLTVLLRHRSGRDVRADLPSGPLDGNSLVPQ